MEIVDYELFSVPPRWQFLKLETSDGLVGWGEPIVEGKRRTVAAAVEELLDTYLLGKDPADIEDHWQAMYRGGFYRGGPVLMSAISGIDQALWDIKGKRFGAPAYELLGGKAREKVRMYQGCGGSDPDEVRESAHRLVHEEGMTALKSGVPVQGTRHVEPPEVVEHMRDYFRAMREGAGPEADFGVDFHGKIRKSMAKRLFKALEEFDPMFYEEPVLSQQNDALPHITQHTTVPIATGERMYSRWDFKEVFEDQTVDIVQPDLSHAGGITECTKIAAMAETYDVALAPHCPLGPIALAACIQVDVNAPNAFIQEPGPSEPDYAPGGDEFHGMDYLSNPEAFAYDEGYVDAPSGPGLGIEVDVETVRAHDGDRDPGRMPARRPDGSVAEK
jgi:galactonate dehydratase